MKSDGVGQGPFTVRSFARPVRLAAQSFVERIQAIFEVSGNGARIEAHSNEIHDRAQHYEAVHRRAGQQNEPAGEKDRAVDGGRAANAKTTERVKNIVGFVVDFGRLT